MCVVAVFLGLQDVFSVLLFLLQLSNKDQNIHLPAQIVFLYE